MDKFGHSVYLDENLCKGCINCIKRCPTQAIRVRDGKAVITKEFCKLSNLDYKKDLIKKIKPTKPQYKAKNRHKNIENSFDINKKLIEKYKNKNILLIDDITTSGATLEEIINCLLNYGFKNITCLTISKA